MAYFELCGSSVLTQNEEIWNFHGSLILNKGKLLAYSGSLLYGIVSNMTHFFILFRMRKNGYFELCALSVLTQNEEIWNFHSSLIFNKGKLIVYSGSLWYAIMSNMTHFSILFGMRKKWRILNYVLHLY